MAAQGLQMLCVELVFGDSTFQLLDASSDAPDCEIMVQRRTSENTLWQKEQLLNIALDNLPASVTKVIGSTPTSSSSTTTGCPRPPSC